MDLLTLVFKLPLLPVQGTIRLAEVIQDEAERQLHDPTRIRRELDEVQRKEEAGEISTEEMAEAEDKLANTMVKGRVPPQ